MTPKAKSPSVKKAPASSSGRSVRHLFTSESVTEGHPDKVCDYVADSILDACLAGDRASHVACEVLCKEEHLVLAGEITSAAEVDFEAVAREAVREIGYTDPGERFSAGTLRITRFLSRQSPEIAQGVTGASHPGLEQGAGDQGIMFGYATDETKELMPLPILLAHRLASGLARSRRDGRHPWLRPDGKTQVCVLYENGTPKEVREILVSTQHTAAASQESILAYVTGELAPACLGSWHHPGLPTRANPTGSFLLGGPSADCGVTGRKIIVDTYGGAARHGGGAFSGKDPSKVDRSGAYFCRYVARRLILEGLARRAEVQVAYAIGVAKPMAVKVETFGTGNPRTAARFVEEFDFRPAAIIERLDLLRPIYRKTTNYGHFGRPGLPWEA